jgi:hypothetical protein
MSLWGRAARPAPRRFGRSPARPARTIGALIALAVLVGCVGTLASTIRGPSSLGIPEAFECAQRELPALGYKVITFDREAGQLTAEKTDPKARRPHTLFIRVVDQIEVHASAAASGSELEVRARTMAEFGSQRGPTREEDPASDTARADARTLLERCGK